MDFIKSLWPNSSNNVITIPQHIEGELEDDIDLKVKALTYIYKRIEFTKLPAFIQDENGVFNLKLKDHDNNNNINNNNINNDDGDTKLDAIYNVSEFERLLFNDEHRILIDWFKNRFRSICILSGEPSYTFDKTLGKNFKFTFLPPNSTDEVYIKTIVDSDLYLEHFIERSIKVKILSNILERQRELRPSYKKVFNKNDRSNIILQYLRRLSEIVQIERIYRASITSKLDSKLKLDVILENDSNQENGIKLFPSNRSRSNSPKRSKDKILTPLDNASMQLQLQPAVKLTPPSSPIKLTPSPLRSRSKSSSPIKLKKKQSMTLLKMDRLVDEVSNEEELLSKEELITIRQQSEHAVLFRVERERRLLRG